MLLEHGWTDFEVPEKDGKMAWDEYDDDDGYEGYGYETWNIEYGYGPTGDYSIAYEYDNQSGEGYEYRGKYEVGQVASKCTSDGVLSDLIRRSAQAANLEAKKALEHDIERVACELHGK